MELPTNNQESVWLIPDGKLNDSIAETSERAVLQRFDMRKRIGEGGMGIVFEAHDYHKGELVAVKVMHADLLSDPTMVKLFATEAAIATSLSHPNIVGVYGTHDVDGGHALVMELLHGQTLRAAINERATLGKKFSLNEVTDIIDQLLEALAYAHEFTVHRDIKPENIWLCQDGQVKLMDFGLARVIQPSQTAQMHQTRTLTRRRLGSPYYMAPEQLQGVAALDHRIDQFAVGVIIYELFTGELPLGLASPLDARRQDLPRRLTQAIDRALATDPEKRFSTITAFRDEFLLGSQEKPPWHHQFPRLRKIVPPLNVTVLSIALIGLTAGVRTSFWQTFSHSSPSLQQDQLQALSKVQYEAEQLRQSLLANEKQWNAIGAEDPVATIPTSGTLGMRILSEARHEILKRDREIATALTQWLSPWIAEDHQPYRIKTLLASASLKLNAGDSDAFARGLGLAQREIKNRAARLDESKAVFQARFQAEAVLSITSTPESESAQVSLAKATDSLTSGGWESGIKAIYALRDSWVAPHEAKYQSLLGELEKAKERWAKQCPEQRPPNLEFLEYPQAKAEAATLWQSLGRYDRAHGLLEESISTINSWTDELIDLHERTHIAWERIPAKDRLENQLGMRFVRVDDNYYWSIWETRVLDFAHFIDSEGKGFADVGDAWKNTGRAQGPTSPVVGLKPRIAQAFTSWLHENSHIAPTGGREHSIPTRELWEKLLQHNYTNEQTSYTFGLGADPDEFDSARWQKYWSDTTVNSSAWIRRVAQGLPSPQGLYDLDGNVWEWCSNRYQPQTGTDLSKAFGTNALGVLFAGGSYGEGSWFGLNPQNTDIRLIARRDAIGFRIVVGVPRE